MFQHVFQKLQATGVSTTCASLAFGPSMWLDGAPRTGYELYRAEGFEFLKPGDGERSIQEILAEAKRQKEEEAKQLLPATSGGRLGTREVQNLWYVPMSTSGNT